MLQRKFSTSIYGLKHPVTSLLVDQVNANRSRRGASEEGSWLEVSHSYGLTRAAK